MFSNYERALLMMAAYIVLGVAAVFMFVVIANLVG